MIMWPKKKIILWIRLEKTRTHTHTFAIRHPQLKMYIRFKSIWAMVAIKNANMSCWNFFYPTWPQWNGQNIWKLDQKIIENNRLYFDTHHCYGTYEGQHIMLKMNLYAAGCSKASESFSNHNSRMKKSGLNWIRKTDFEQIGP